MREWQRDTKAQSFTTATKHAPDGALSSACSHTLHTIGSDYCGPGGGGGGGGGASGAGASGVTITLSSPDSVAGGIGLPLASEPGVLMVPPGTPLVSLDSLWAEAPRGKARKAAQAISVSFSFMDVSSLIWSRLLNPRPSEGFQDDWQEPHDHDQAHAGRDSSR